MRFVIDASVAAALCFDDENGPVADAAPRLTFYDDAYLKLAQRERIELATLDAALARAAIAEGIGLVGA